MHENLVGAREIQRLLRPVIRSLKAYESKPVPNCIRMDANENPLPWPEGMKDELLQGNLSFNRYPDGQARELKQAIAQYTGVPAAGILPGNGSDELIQLILTTFGGQGRAVIVHPPTFSMYQAAAKITGTEVVEVPLLQGVDLDVEGILRSILPAEALEASVIILCNPNNPTGSLFPREELIRIVQESGKIVVIDEAYTEFAGESLVDQISRYPNLLVMRTFSKAFALAGLRLGYLLGQPGTIELLDRARQPFNVNSFTQTAGVIALKYVEGFKEQVNVLQQETQKLYQGLNELHGVTVWNTRANFVLFQPAQPEKVYASLIQRGFLVRNMENLPVIGNALRGSVSFPEDNQRFLHELRGILG